MSEDHLAKDCSERKQPVTAEAGGKSAQTTSTNVIQPAALPKPYMVPLKINAIGKCGNINTYVVDTIIDSGSPISIIRDSIVKDEASPIDEDISQFCGINGSRLKILNIFHGEIELESVRVKVKFYTVPDDTMVYKVLLGRDFLSCPSLRITWRCRKN